ncbi:ChrR family anti-sigma-E factor [Rhizobium sp. R635]|uniref:ChrR family anti-sigma-E factor n=1 Tax=Rhizobium sp. R635 TaxID=1764275 RepID=UPI00167E7BC6|nr:ChrR family anti-sigma-E factor [Rhizobium sp. R635]
MTETQMVHGHIDTIDALMAHYVAGTLPEPARVLVRSHLEMKADNRSFVNGLELLAGEALENAAGIAIAERDRQLQAIFASASPIPEPPTSARPKPALFPRALRDLVGFEAEDVPWRKRLPGFKEYSLDRDGCEVNLMWIRPGRALPAHTHKGMELILILDGAFNDERGHFGPGDISIADETVEHRPVAEADGPCIAFTVSDGPVRLTGSFRQMMSDLIG